MSTIITNLPPWAFFLLVLLFGILAFKTGAWVKKIREQKHIDDKSTPVVSLLGAILGLLAFMLGFTFSITSDRFSERMQLVVEQGKAIGTCYLRTDLLPDNQKLESKRLFGNYINLLVDIPKSEEIKLNITRIEAIQKEIWNVTSSLKSENMDPQLRSLYVSSVNDMFDIFDERKTVVLLFKIPWPIWAVLLLVYFLSMFVVGLENNSSKLRSNLNIPIITAAFALVVTLIATMDASTKSSHFSITQQPLIDVQQMIRSDSIWKHQ